MSRRLIHAVNPIGRDVIEFGSGVGRTARDILDRRPRSYIAVDQDPGALALVEQVVAGRPDGIVLASAATTGLPGSSADIVVGEAVLTMQSATSKAEIIAEARRLLRPGGRYALHELALIPDSLTEPVKTEIQQALARATKINARPLTVPEWSALLHEHGLIVQQVDTAPMALLQPRRLVADEGLRGAIRFAVNLLAQPDARHRVFAMRRTFRRYRRNLVAVTMVAESASESSSSA